MIDGRDEGRPVEMDVRRVDRAGVTCFDAVAKAGSLTVAPKRGGRIVSLRDVTGREWLAPPDPATWRLPMKTGRFVESDMAGWDECAPTINATRWEGIEYPDHGDLWHRQWSVEVGPDAGIAVSCTAGWFTLRRSIRATRTGFRLDYEARSSVAAPRPFLWAAHPQFRAPDGSRVTLPSHVTEVVDAIDPAAPTLAASKDLLRIGSLAPGGTRKLITPSATRVGAATLVHPDGVRLGLRWDEAVVPWVGVWMDRSAFSREDVIAIEPMTGWFDNAADAASGGRCAFLGADAPLRWWLELDLVEPA
jgi:galactose mutarotase-like enzyme